MIKLTKRIEKTIASELNQDFTALKCVYIKSMYTDLCVHLIVLRESKENKLLIMRFFGDGIYDFLGGFYNWEEVKLEIENQVKQLL